MSKPKGFGRGLSARFTAQSDGAGFGGGRFGAPSVADDDWDDEPKTSTDFGSGKPRGGFGSGSVLNGTTDSTSRSGFGSERSGFGGGSSGGDGFGSRGGFGGGDSGGSSGGGGGFGGRAGFGGGDSGSGGGFGARAGFGSGDTGGRSGGFGASSDDAAGGGGGFGSRSSGSGFGGGGGSGFGGGRSGFGGSGGGSSSGCRSCGEEGHFARECPNKPSGGGSGGSGCRSCGEEGHFARECPNKPSGGGGGACHVCGQEGHFARECPQKPAGGGGGGGGNCFNCGQSGHISKDCPEPPKNGDSDRPRENYVPEEASEESIYAKVHKGINFDRYDSIKVEISGGPDNAEKPAQCHRFEDMGIAELFLNNLRNKMQYTKPTPIQKSGIPCILAGYDVMACAQTGSGKTCAFLIPILTGMVRSGLQSEAFQECQTPQAVVVSPTRELAIQIYNDCRAYASGTILRPVVVYGGTSTGYLLSQLSRGANIVIATPGRLKDMCDRNKISFEKVKYLVLDEADRMLDMGFEPEMRRLTSSYGIPPKSERQTLMFSATFPQQIQKLAADFLRPDYLYITVGIVGAANEDVTQKIIEVDSGNATASKRDKLIEILTANNGERALVFVETKRTADFLASFLCQSQLPCTSIHGDRLQRERETALRDFKSGKSWVCVATSVAARGLDIPGVEHVINYDIPKDRDEYVHRIGRTGRCGNMGKATSFYNHSYDSEMARHLVQILQDAHQEIPDFLESAARGGYGGGGGYSAPDNFSDTRQGVASIQISSTTDESWD